MNLIGEKLIADYTRRKREITSKKILRCPECGEIGLKNVGDKYIHFQHKIYSTPMGANRVESCLVKK